MAKSWERWRRGLVATKADAIGELIGRDTRKLLFLNAHLPEATDEERDNIALDKLAPLLHDAVENCSERGMCHVEITDDDAKSVKYAFSIRAAEAREFVRIYADDRLAAEAYVARVRRFDPIAACLSQIRRVIDDMGTDDKVTLLQSLGMLTRSHGGKPRLAFGDIELGDHDTLWRTYLLLVAGASFLIDRKAPAGVNVQRLLETIMSNAEQSVYAGYLDMAWDSLSDKEKGEVRVAFHSRVLKALQGGGAFEARTKEAILQKVADLATEEVDRRVEEIRARVVAECDKRWEEMVESVVTRRLAEAVAKIKAEMAK